MKALYFNDFGSVGELIYGDLPRPMRKEGEVLVQTAFIGLNFADIYRRRGTYHIEPHRPYINGYEGSGIIVEADDANIVGQKVLFVDCPLANAELVAVPLEKIIFLPDEISLKLAASIGLQGLTADFLAHDLGQNKSGDKVFVTGISGGVGQLLAQILLADGVEVSGSASLNKQNVARSFGVNQLFNSRTNDWVEREKNQFDTVFDGVGSTINQSLDLVKHRGKVVFFGMAGGNPPLINPVDLMAESKSVMTGDLWDYLTSFEERERRARRLFSYITSGKIQLTEPTVFELADGQAAHEFLETGKNIGKILFVTENIKD